MGCSFKKGASYESIWIWIFIANLPGSDYLVLSRGYLSLCQGMFKWGEKEFWIPTFSFCGVSCSNYFANYAGDIVSRSFRLDASPTVGVFYLLVTTVTPLDCRIAFAGQRLLLSVLRCISSHTFNLSSPFSINTVDSILAMAGSVILIRS